MKSQEENALEIFNQVKDHSKRKHPDSGIVKKKEKAVRKAVIKKEVFRHVLRKSHLRNHPHLDSEMRKKKIGLYEAAEVFKAGQRKNHLKNLLVLKNEVKEPKEDIKTADQSAAFLRNSVVSSSRVTLKLHLAKPPQAQYRKGKRSLSG